MFYRGPGALRTAATEGGIHCLRHSFATHLLEAGVEITVIKMLLGHRSLPRPPNYLHVSGERLAQIRSPLDFIREPAPRVT